MRSRTESTHRRRPPDVVVVAVVFLAVMLGVAGVYALASKSLNTAEADTTEVSRDYLLGVVQMGQTISETRNILGPADHTQHFEQQYGGRTHTSDCLYYGSTQLCFKDGKLTSKASY